MQATASITAGAHGDSLAASYPYNEQAHAEEMDRLQKFYEDDGNCMRGILVALGVEAALGILIFCFVWLGLHFVR
jgi:hypothetical protein